MSGKFTACKVISSSVFTFDKKSIQQGIVADLESQGFTVKKAVWNEKGTKLEVTTTAKVK